MRDALNRDPSAEGAHQHTVTFEQEGWRLDRVLGSLTLIASRTAAQRLIEAGRVQLNGQPARERRTPVQHGDRILCLSASNERSEEANLRAPQAQQGSLCLCYEDRHLVVLDKPAGLAVHPSRGHSDGTLVNFLLGHRPLWAQSDEPHRPGIVHRLDMNTSGLMVVAKTNLAHHRLARQFAAHQVYKAYQALTVGVPKQPAGTLEAPLQRDRRHPQRQAIAPPGQGKAACTHYRVQATLGLAEDQRQAAPRFARVRLRPQTGRTHQLRVHLAALGCPIVGDDRYGGRGYRGLSDLKAEEQTTLDAFARHALHAEELGFWHPTERRAMLFRAPWPADMRALLRFLEGLGESTPSPKKRRVDP